MVEKKKNLNAKPEEEKKPSEQTNSAKNEVDKPAEGCQPVMIAMTQEEYDAAQKELETARKQAQEYLDGWQRERAELANYKRRIERDQSQLSQNITGQIVKKYLAVVDDMERALKTRPQNGDGAAWAEGVELIYRKLTGILENEGVKRIEVEHECFDPNLHEAISHEENADVESGHIIEVVQQGYMIGDRVLRPALVRVAR